MSSNSTLQITFGVIDAPSQPAQCFVVEVSILNLFLSDSNVKLNCEATA